MLYPFYFLAVVSIAAAIYFVIIEPKRKISQFCQNARKAGYKVKEIPFNIFSFFMVKYLWQEECSLRIFKEELKQYDIIVGNFFNKMSIIPNHPDILKDLYSQTNKVQKDPLFVNLFRVLFKGGIPLAEGEEWKRKRRIMSSLFHFDFINQMYPQLEKEIEQEMKIIDEKVQKGENIKILGSCYKILSTVIMKCFFQTELGDHMINGKTFPEFFLKLLDQIANYTQSFEQLAFGLIPFKYGLTKRARDIKQKIRISNSIATQIVEKQLKKLKNGQITEKNLLTVLYQNNMFNQTTTYDQTKYTKEDFIGQFFSLFAAGSDTTSHTTNLILHYLSENKEWLQKIKQQFKQLESIEGPEKLKKTKWTDAVISQILRLGGPAPVMFSRHVVQNVNAGGILIPKNTSLNIFPIMNQYNERYFEKPFQFRPQRWVQNQNIPPSFAYVPFSAGERNCIGQYLARMQLKTIVSKFIGRYYFKAKNPIKMYFEFITKTRNDDFQMQINSKN